MKRMNDKKNKILTPFPLKSANLPRKYGQKTLMTDPMEIKNPI